MPLPIEDYAFLSDLHSAALVGRDGSIDWLTFPRFDSGACFAALLGTPENGRWRIAPQATPGSVENLRLINEGQIESGFAQSDLAGWAHKGIGDFAGSGRMSKLRAIASLSSRRTRWR